jgi:hypothetical protein
LWAHDLWQMWVAHYSGWRTRFAGHLVSLRTKHQIVFPPQYEDGPTRIRTFLNQPVWCCLFCSWAPA